MAQPTGPPVGPSRPTTAPGSPSDGPSVDSAEPRPADESAALVDPLSSFTTLLPRLSGPAGIAVVATRSSRAYTAGPLQRDVAWSTSKVPLAMAALAGPAAPETGALVRAAITESDNAAAERLWSLLGSGSAAAGRTEAALRAGGDLATSVQSQRVRPGYTPFGQTNWALADAARFASNLPCLPQARQVLPLMRQVVDSQRWGLGRIPGTALKGGWGPEAGGYVARQLAVLTRADGTTVGVAVMVQSPQGFDRAVADLDVVTGWLAARLQTVPSGSCAASPRPDRAGGEES